MATLARTRDIVHASMAKREPFRRGNLSGGYVADLSSTGRLSGEDLQHWRNDAPLYAVRSYATPIAWLAHDSDGMPVWRIVRESFSPTTTHHVSVVRMGAHYASEREV